ncbi:MAG: LD-carboxypeptidase [Acholeplasmatales bacterium]|nr:LD-carboxypeptidase [Acholeplasmatales bacterium]
MKADYINNGDTIYLVAPSFGCVTSPYKKRLEKSINNFKALGYKVIEGDNIFKALGYASSNTKELRGKEINDAFKSDAKVVLSVGGGEVMTEILPFVDFDIIKENPKWYVGFSDNTNLTYTITTILDIETIYGNCAPSYYNLPLTYDRLDTFNLLEGKLEYKGYKKFQTTSTKKIFPDYEFNRNTKIINYNNFDILEGRLIGGCLDCLQVLCGTKFDKTKEYIKRHKEEGIIFFLEACDFNSVGVIRALTQLKNSGWFDDVKGFIIGRSLNMNDKSFGINMIDAYINVLGDLNLPMLLNISLGHINPSLPIRCGGYAKVEYKKHNIYITYKE